MATGGAAALLVTVVLGLSRSAPGTDAPPSSAAAAGTVLVTLADGSTVPLRGWSLSYEFGRYRQGESPLSGTNARRDGQQLFLGKRVLPVAGLTVTFVHAKAGDLLVVKTLQVTGRDGKATEHKVEAPARDLLVTDLPRGEAVMARTLDLRGETVTGGHQDLCLISYTSVVQCGTTAEDRVVKLEFE
jgi:hypothetical protein